jgi:hypothetical protein
MASVDSVRELRTMILVSLPYPPLPVMVERVEEGERVVSGTTMATSHDIIAMCLDRALNQIVSRHVQDDELKRRRLVCLCVFGLGALIPATRTLHRERERDALQRFLHALATRGFHETDPEKLYDIYCEFTRAHIFAYFEPGQPLPPVCFMPYSHVANGDSVHAKMCEYLAGQSELFRENPIVKREDLAQFDFGQLLFKCRHGSRFLKGFGLTLS